MRGRERRLGGTRSGTGGIRSPNGYKLQGKHLEDAGLWVQDKMTEARTAGESTNPGNTATRISPRFAQMMNHVDYTPQEHISPESRWINSEDDYKVLGMFVFD